MEYTHYRLPQGENIANIPAKLDSSKAFNRLVNQVLQPLQENLALPGSDNQLRIFIDGGNPYKITDKAIQPIILDETKAILASYCAEYFSEDGEIIAEHEQDWRNMNDLVPQLVRAMLDRPRETHLDSNVSLLQQHSALNIVGAACYLTKNPNASFSIRTGIGGSDAESINTRFPLYAMPAAEIITRINNVYERRVKERIINSVVFDQLVQQLIAQDPTRDIKEIKAQVNSSLPSNPLEILSKEQLARAYRTYAIRTQPVKLEFIIAHHAAQEINLGDPEDPASELRRKFRIKSNAQESSIAIRTFIGEYYPDLTNNLFIYEDAPWEKHSLYEQLLVNYFTNLVEGSDDEHVKAALKVLSNRGDNHGGIHGASRSSTYAALHPIIFHDRLNLPYTNKFGRKDDKKPEILLTIGGRPERHFDLVRDYISQNASVTGLIEYINNLYGKELPTDVNNLIKVLNRWQNLAIETRNDNLNVPPMVDLPIHQATMITPIGTIPTYYSTEFDLAYGANIDEQIRYAEERLAKIIEQKKTTNSSDRDKIQQLAVREDQGKYVLDDLRRLRRLIK